MSETTVDDNANPHSGDRDGYESEAAAALDFAVDHLAPVELHTIPGEAHFYTVAAGQRVVRLDLEQYGETPTRKRGSLVMHEGPSFATYMNEHNDGASAIYADVQNRQVVGILNGNNPSAPGWGDHRVTLNLRHTDEWKAWATRNGLIEGQQAFAEHIEANLLDIVEPDGATMLELAQSFQAHVNVDFKRAERLQSGETALRFEETIEARAGRAGEIDIPPVFVLALPVFEGDAPTTIEARLRYRLRDGKLTIGYQLIRPEQAVRTSFDAVLANIEAAVGIEAYRGAAPASLRP